MNTISSTEFKSVLIRRPVNNKSNNWRETAFEWRVWINNESFLYYTGCGLVSKRGNPIKPTLDGVLYSLLSDAGAADESFEDWCDNFGMDTDSRKALDMYLDCQVIDRKLRKAGINISVERERLQDY